MDSIIKIRSIKRAPVPTSAFILTILRLRPPGLRLPPFPDRPQPYLLDRSLLVGDMPMYHFDPPRQRHLHRATIGSGRLLVVFAYRPHLVFSFPYQVLLPSYASKSAKRR